MKAEGDWKMRVAIFTDAYVPQINGVSKTLSKLVEYFEENGIQYRVVAPAFKNIKSNDKVLRYNSVKLLIYPDCRLSVPNYLSVKREMNKFKPDIIHVITEFSLGLCGLRYAKTHNVPVVSSYETNIPQYLKYYHMKFLEKRSWAFFRWFHGKCDRSFSPSLATLELLKSKGLNNLDVWERGIELGSFSPKNRDEELRESMNVKDKLVFLYVGRVSAEKNLEIFLRVAEKLDEKYKDKIHFIMVGGGPSLKKLIAIAPKNITFTGFVKGIKLAKIYASADVFLFPSATETLGFVVLEAMASGLPVICCGEGGVKDNVIDGHNGIICEHKNVQEYCTAAEKLINDPSLRHRMSENAIEHAAHKDWNNAIANLVDGYRDVIESKQS